MAAEAQLTTPPKRVILWTAPRSGSSVFARSFMQRADTRVFFELLFEAFYLGGPEREQRREQRSSNSGADDLQHDSLPWRGPTEVYEEMLASQPVDISLVMAKEMAYYVMPADRASPFEWPAAWDSFEHTFLIRSPMQQVPSFVEVMRAAERAEGLPPAELDATELGVAQLHRLFDEVRKRTGRVPLLIDVEDLWRDPRSALTAYCKALGVPFDEAMLSWSPGCRPEFRSLDHPNPSARLSALWNAVWVRDVLDSTGFLRGGSTQREAESKGVVAPAPAPLPAAIETAMHEAVALYEQMRVHRLRIP